MTWDSNVPKANESVKANRTRFVNNFTYIANVMGTPAAGSENLNTTKDHFWSNNGNLNGRHRFIKSPAFTSSGSPADPVMGADCDCVWYAKRLLSINSTVQQDVQPFYRNSTQIMQMLGIRAMGVFNGSSSDPAQADVVYSFNLNTQAAASKGIKRNSTGDYTVNFSNSLPSANYLVIGGTVRATSGPGVLVVQGNGTLSNVKTTTFFKFFTERLSSGGPELQDPTQAWFVVFGG